MFSANLQPVMLETVIPVSSNVRFAMWSVRQALLVLNVMSMWR